MSFDPLTNRRRQYRLAGEIARLAVEGMHPNGVENYCDEQERCDAAEVFAHSVVALALELVELVNEERVWRDYCSNDPGEPEFGVWLMPEQVEALHQFLSDETGLYPDQDGGMVTLTDMRSEDVTELAAAHLNEMRGAVLVEQETGGPAIVAIQRFAMIDRHGKLFPLSPS